MIDPTHSLLETFGLMCANAPNGMLSEPGGQIEQINRLLEEAEAFEAFHAREAKAAQLEMNFYWDSEVNGSWYEAVDQWLALCREKDAVDQFT